MKKYFTLSNLKELAKWILKGKYYFFTLFVVIMTFLCVSKIWTLRSDLVSLAFSLLGLGILLWLQISDAREFSIHKPNTLGYWIKSFPTLKPVILKVDSAVMRTSVGKAHLIFTIAENESIEKKVSYLLAQLKNFQQSMGDIEDRIEEVDSRMTRTTEGINSDVVKLENSLKSVIAGHIIGDYDKNFFAIIITLCGTLIQFFT